jgi:hypothetical protein
MNRFSTAFSLLAVIGALALGGCAAPAPADSAPPVVVAAPPPKVDPKPVVTAPIAPPVVPKEPSPGEKALAAATASYDRGEYAPAIRQLTPLTTDGSLDQANQLQALKLLAFSECLSRKITACRKTFERAFRLDHQFDLAPAEKGHPVWGPQFERARKAVTGVRAK